MNILRKLFVLSLVFSVIGFSSCKDDCTAPELSENIVGVWNPSISGGEVEFKSDGTLVDLDDAILGIGSATATKTYSISGTTLSVTAEEGGSSVSTEFDVTQNECDQIKITVLVFTETLNRK